MEAVENTQGTNPKMIAIIGGTALVLTGIAVFRKKLTSKFSRTNTED